MAAITFMAMKTDTENLARYNDELAKCHTDVQTKNKVFTKADIGTDGEWKALTVSAQSKKLAQLYVKDV